MSAGAIARLIVEGSRLPPIQIFVAPTIPLAIGAVAALVLRPIARDGFGRQDAEPF